MNDQTGTQAASAEFLAFQEKVKGTNINVQTLLATDYLNHFNEVVMLFEMIADMPDMFEEIQAWAPRTYQDHFRLSGFSDKDLAVEAYEHVPIEFLEAFEHTIQQVNRIIQICIERVEGAIMIGDPGRIPIDIGLLVQMVSRLLDIAGGIINGSSKTMDQSEIDVLIDADGEGQAPPQSNADTQSSIDALFD